MSVSLTLLSRYNEEDDKFLDQIIIEDSFVHYWTPTLKQASLSWKLNYGI